MNIYANYLKRNADPGCEACQGDGYVCRAKEPVHLGKGTMIIGDKNYPVSNTVYNPVSHDPCPRCFGPNGEPRTGQRVEK